MTSSDDQPRYRRGSKRRPKPPKTPPGLVQLEHPSLAVAHFDGKGKGYAAVAPILASSLLLQERPLTVTGAFDSAQDARKALAKIVCDDDEYAHLRGTPEERGRGEGRVKAEGSPGPSSVSGDVWLATLARLANSPFVRVTRVGKANGGDDGSKDLDTAAEQVDGKDTYAARLLARVSTCNHSCRPNAAVSVSDDLVTLYSLRRIEAGEEITVSYGTSLLWLPLQMRRTQLARVWGFVCKCQRCEVDLHRAMAERERAHGTMRRVASRHGFRESGSFQTRHDDLAGVIEWEYGETGFESQFDEEGRVRGTILDGSRADEGGVGVNGRKMSGSGRRAAPDTDTPDSSDTDTSSFDSSDEFELLRRGIRTKGKDSTERRGQDEGRVGQGDGPRASVQPAGEGGDRARPLADARDARGARVQAAEQGGEEGFRPGLTP